MHFKYTFKNKYDTRYFGSTGHFSKSVCPRDVCCNEESPPPSMIMVRGQHCLSNDISHSVPLYSEDIPPVPDTSQEAYDDIFWINTRSPREKSYGRSLDGGSGGICITLSRITLSLPSIRPHSESFPGHFEAPGSLPCIIRETHSQPTAKGGSK